MLERRLLKSGALAVALGVCLLPGCKKEESDPSGAATNQGGTGGVARAVGPAGSPVAPTLDQGWCGGHGVPESVCTRCNSSLIETFKAVGDWCAEHGLPETQCFVCHPEIEAEWAKLNISGAGASGPPLGPAGSPVAPTLDQGWCGGHGVPESVCTRCNSSLIETFKAAGDWCEAHDLPETQCFVCHPEVEAEWAKLNPANAEAAGAAFGPASSPVAPTLDQGWCGGHGVPESVCTRCNSSLIETFKKAGDWCAEHGLPETQCMVCHPEVATEWAKLNPAARRKNERGDAGGAGKRSHSSRAVPALAEGGMRAERPERLVTEANDPLCQVEQLRVRLADASIAEKAGITVERVRRRPMSATLVVPAEVEFDATRLTRITPRVGGVVLDVSAELGAEVRAGDVVAILDSPAVGEAKSAYIERKQNLGLAEADLERATTIYRGALRMLDVCSVDADPQAVRAALKDSPIGEAKASLLRAHAALLLARAEAARQAALRAKNLSSDRDHQAAESALAAAEAEFVAIQEEIAFDIERKRLAARREVEVSRGALDSAARRLHILGLDAEQIAKIGTGADEYLTRLAVRSPVAGRVIERSAAVGESVEPSDVLFAVADHSVMWLMADLYERDLIHMRIGLPVLFTVDGMPGASFEGEVAWISSQIDDRTRTVGVRADLPNPSGLLRAKMFGDARIVLHDNEEVVTVSVDAVQTDGCCQLVFVQESETVFQPRKIALGTRVNDVVEVIDGLREGERVAAVGSFLMKTEILKGNIGAGCCEVDPGR